jgi:DNA-binding MarR family transcriptional regulator
MAAAVDLREPPRTSRDTPGMLGEAIQEMLLEAMVVYRLTGREQGLSMPQLLVLKAIRSHGPSRPSDIARHFMVSRPAITEAMNALESSGWIRRSRTTGDRRGQLGSLTPRSERVLALMDRRQKAIYEAACERLSRRRAAEMLETLGAITEGLRRYRESVLREPSELCGRAP